MSKSVEEILYWFGETFLQISGSTDDVDLIEKEHEKLYSQVLQELCQIILEGLPKKKPYHEESPKMSETENDGLRMWDNGYNQALFACQEKIKEMFNETP